MSVWRTSRPRPELTPGHESVGRDRREPEADPKGDSGRGEAVADIGKSITIKGDLSGDEDLVLDGRIEGRVELSDHHLTIGPNGHIQAELVAREVTINGRVVGNVTATERVEIGASGRLDGDVAAPRLLVQEGAQLNGSVTMKTSPTVAPAKRAAEKGAAPASDRPSKSPPEGPRPSL